MKLPRISSYLRTLSLQNSKKVIYFKITFYFPTKKTIFVSTNIKVSPQNFKRNTILSSEEDYEQKLKIIRWYHKQIQNIVDRYFFNDKILTPEQFKVEWKKINTKNFFDYAYKKIEQWTHLKRNTKTIYLQKIRNIQEFAPNLTFEQINEKFINDFKNHMLQKNHENTVRKNLQVFKHIIMEAFNEGIIETNPFARIKIGTIKGNRQPLNETEIRKIEKYFETCTNFYEKNALIYFLIACYTGLRFSDIRRLSNENLFETEINGKKIYYLSIKQAKTNKLVNVPLIEKAKKLLLSENQKIIKIEKISNHRLNENLRKLAKKLNINKPLHIHIGRHTFATLLLNKGVPIEVVSKLLGHSSIRTSLDYTKVYDAYVFDNLLNINL